MTMFFDSVPISGTRKTQDGYLVADVRVARTGIQEYLGVEVDPDGTLGLRDKKMVRVFRPEEEVFSTDAMRSYAHRPVTNDHPSESVSAENWRRLAVGQTDGKVVRDGDWVQVPMVLMDASVISLVEGGKRQLSMGYQCVLDATPGVTEKGEQYDAVQRSLRMNHLAVVAAARAGAGARIGDGSQLSLPADATEDNRMNMQKVVVDGLTIETTDQGAQVIAKLQSQLVDASNTLKEEKEKNKSKDAEIAKKDAEIDDLKTKVLSGAQLDAAVMARSSLIDKAKRISPQTKTDGLSDAEVKRQVVVSRLGDSMKDKPEAYIDARFDILAEDSKVTEDAQKDLRIALGSTTNTGDAARTYNEAVAASVANLNAHRSK